MANTSSIFKGSRTKLLTKDGLGLEAGQTIKVTDGAAVGATFVSDSTGKMVVTSTGADTQDPTGWVDGDSIAVSYDSGTQKVTLTGTLDYYYRGEKRSLTSPWTSTAHTNTTGNTYFLYIDSAGASAWMTNSSPGFNTVLVAFVYYGATNKFGIKETHGLMDWLSHKTLHTTIGTYRVSGGAVTAGSYLLNTNTVAAVTPAVDQAVVADEDLTVTVPALVDGSTYTRLHFDSGAAVFTTGSTFPYPDNGSDIQYNQNPASGTALTAMTSNGRYVNVYGVFVPATADAGSQAYRMVWIIGQQIYTSSGAAVSEDFRTLNLGDLTSIFAEFVPYIRITYVTTNSNLTSDAQVAVNPTYLIGNKLSLVSVSGLTPTDHGSLSGLTTADSHPASAVSTVVTSFNNRLTSSETTVQSALDKLDDIVTPANLGGTGVSNNAAATLTRTGNHALTVTTTNTTSVTLPTAGTLATLAGTETLSAKTLSAAAVGGASNDGTDGFLKFKDQSAAATAATGDDTNVFAVDRKIYKRDASGTREIGKLTGEINYIGNPSGTDDINDAVPAGWGTSLTTPTFKVTKTAAELPRETTTGSAMKFYTPDETYGGEYVYRDFTLDDVDLNKMLQVAWDQKIIDDFDATTGNFEWYIAAQSDRTTPLYGTLTDIPAQDGTYSSKFLSQSTAALSLVLRVKVYGSVVDESSFAISNVYVGPGTLVQGAAVGDWRSFTPTWTGGSPSVGNGTLVGYYRRVGDSAEVRIRLLSGTTTSWGDATNWQFGIAAIGTVDQTKLATTARFGSASATVSASLLTYNGKLYLTSATTVGVITSESAVGETAWDAGNPSSWTATTANQSFSLEFTVPITEWSSGVYLGSGADGTSVLDWTAYTASVAPSASGSITPNTVSAFYRRVGDSAQVIIPSFTVSSVSSPVGNILVGLPSGLTIRKLSASFPVGSGSFFDSSASAQMAIRADVDTPTNAVKLTSADEVAIPTPAASDVFVVEFMVPIVGWTSADYLGKMLVGFGSAGVGRSGLVNNDSSNVTGTPIKGRTDGVAATAGYVGEFVEAAGSATSITTGQYSDGGNAGITLTPGIWDIQSTVQLVPAATTTVARFFAAIGTASGNASTGIDSNKNTTYLQYGSPGPVLGDGAVIASPLWRVRISSNTTYYPKTYAVFGTSTCTANNYIFARRVA